MNDLLDFLKSAAITGEVITVAYGGGSRPGESRQLMVASCSESELRAYEAGVRIQKSYKLAKILWAENSLGQRVTSQESVGAFQSELPVLETLKQYADHLFAELTQAGWHLHQESDLFGVSTPFKNGKSKKNPSISVCYVDRSSDLVWDLETNGLIEVKKELTGRERPWRVDSSRMKEGKAFGRLHAAMELFLAEVRESGSQPTKGRRVG